MLWRKWSTFGFSFGQLQIGEKSNEITAIPALLEKVDYQGSIISIDAIGCQKAIAAKIRDKPADYLIALKANQGALYEQVSDLMTTRKDGLPHYHTWDKGHGRGEERRVYVAQDIRWIEEAEHWPGLKSLVMVERKQHLPSGKVQQQVQYYITTPKEFAAYVRGHWGIKNGLHWQLDFTFREYHSRIRKDSGPTNLHLL